MSYTLISTSLPTEVVQVSITGDFTGINYVTKLNEFTKADFDGPWGSDPVNPPTWECLELLDGSIRSKNFLKDFGDEAVKTGKKKTMSDNEIVDNLIPRDRNGDMCKEVRIDYIRYYDSAGLVYDIIF